MTYEKMYLLVSSFLFEGDYFQNDFFEAYFYNSFKPWVLPTLAQVGTLPFEYVLIYQKWHTNF